MVVVVGTWLWSTLVVLLLYSTANVKILTEYEILSRVSCEVMASHLFFPPGASTSEALHQQAADFRNTSARYFQSPLNHYLPEHAGLEAQLAAETVGLVTAEQFRERREKLEAEAVEKRGREEEEEREAVEQMRKRRLAKKAKREQQEKAKLSFEAEDE